MSYNYLDNTKQEKDHINKNMGTKKAKIHRRHGKKVAKPETVMP